MPMTYMAPFNWVSLASRFIGAQRDRDRQTDRYRDRERERDRYRDTERVLRQKPHNACLYC